MHEGEKKQLEQQLHIHDFKEAMFHKIAQTSCSCALFTIARWHLVNAVERVREKSA